jgi:hypothetical protein
LQESGAKLSQQLQVFGHTVCCCMHQQGFHKLHPWIMALSLVVACHMIGMYWCAWSLQENGLRVCLQESGAKQGCIDSSLDHGLERIHCSAQPASVVCCVKLLLLAPRQTVRL